MGGLVSRVPVRGAERAQTDQCGRGGPQPAAPLEQQAEGGGEARVERQLGDQLGEQVLGAAVLAARPLAVDDMPLGSRWHLVSSEYE